MNFIKRLHDKKLRKKLALQTNFTIAEIPALLRWINGDDGAEKELKRLYEVRASDFQNPT